MAIKKSLGGPDASDDNGVEYFDPQTVEVPSGEEEVTKDGVPSTEVEAPPLEKKFSHEPEGELSDFDRLLKKENSAKEQKVQKSIELNTPHVEVVKGESAPMVVNSSSSDEIVVADVKTEEPGFKQRKANDESTIHMLVASIIASMDSMDQTGVLSKDDELSVPVKNVLSSIQTWFSGLGQALHSWEVNSHKTFEGAKMLDHLPVQTESLLTKNQFSEIRGSTYSVVVKPILAMVLATVVGKLNETLMTPHATQSDDHQSLEVAEENSAKRQWSASLTRTVPFDQLYGEPRLVLARMNNLLSSTGASMMVYSSSQLNDLAAIVSLGTKVIHVLKVTPLRVEYELVTLM